MGGGSKAWGLGERKSGFSKASYGSGGFGG